MLIRPEQPGDAAGIFQVHAAAFPADDEAKLVDALRAAGRLVVSVVAENAGQVVGHVAFSPVTVGGAAGGLGLAPLAVLPEYQRRGVGGRLVREGLAVAARTGAGFVVVLGHPGYYPRFGFHPAGPLGLGSVYGAGDEFMVVGLAPGAIPAGGGLVRYGPEFGAWDPA